MESDFGKIRPLRTDDEKTFQRYKAGIRKAILETFPSLPADFDPQPAGVSVSNACAILYTYMVSLPDGNFAKVDFSVGGLPAPGTPMDREPTFRIDPEPKSSCFE